MTKIAPLLAFVVLASCVADATEEPLADVEEPGLRHGYGDVPSSPVTASHAWLEQHRDACGEACFDVHVHVCAEADTCADADPTETVTCADQYLSCDAAEHADRGDLAGLSYCWRDCSGLQ